MEIDVSYSEVNRSFDDLSDEFTKIYLDKLEDYFENLNVSKKQKIEIIDKIIKMYR